MEELQCANPTITFCDKILLPFGIVAVFIYSHNDQPFCRRKAVKLYIPRKYLDILSSTEFAYCLHLPINFFVPGIVRRYTQLTNFHRDFFVR